MAYEPSNPPSDPAELSAWVMSEITQIARLLNDGARIVIVQQSFAAPAKPREGMLVNADGTTWNPGGGGGLYQRLSAAWVRLGSGGSPGGSTTQIQYNNAGSFGGSSRFTLDTSNGIIAPAAAATASSITLKGGESTAGDGGQAILEGGAAAPSISGGGVGGKATVRGASGSGVNKAGGDAEMLGGLGGNGGTGGHCLIQPGAPGTTGTVRGNIKLDGGGGAALPTNTQGGFVTYPSCAGTPTGTPRNVPTGGVATLIDTTNSKLYAYIGGAWKSATLT